MKQLLIVISALLLLQSCTNKANDFAEFEVTDVSKPLMFIDSITGAVHWPSQGHANVDLLINGELDSAATVSFGATDKRYVSVQTVELNKGEIGINHKIDYYGGDTIWIKYMPKGATKGHLTIKTRVN